MKTTRRIIIVNYLFNFYKNKDSVKIKDILTGSWDTLSKYADQMQEVMDGYGIAMEVNAVKLLHIDRTSGGYEIQRVIQYNKTIGQRDSIQDLKDAILDRID